MTEPVTWQEPIHKDLVLNANKKLHWAPKAEKVRALKLMGRLRHRTLPKFSRVRMDVLVSYPDGRSRDVANLHPTMKHYLDGLVDQHPVTKLGQGILPDDNDRFFKGPYLDPSGVKSRIKDNFIFEITLTPLPPLE